MKKSELRKLIREEIVNLKEGSLKKDVIDLYYKIYDKDPDHFDQKTLDGFIPPRLINNSDLNYDDMFKKMNNEDLTNLLKYFKSIYKK